MRQRRPVVALGSLARVSSTCEHSGGRALARRGGITGSAMLMRVRRRKRKSLIGTSGIEGQRY
jgi:hypothetical protein